MHYQNNERVKWLWILAIISLLGLLFWRNQNQVPETLTFNSEDEQIYSEGSKDQTNSPQQIGVHVAGAVYRPGVYFLSLEARVVEAIQAGGGVLESADLNQINLAETLFDGQKVYIPKKETGVETSQSRDEARSEKININRGSKADLLNLPGIGPSKAAAIIHYREENGSFRQLKDLTKVSGIGEKTFLRLKDLITLY